MSHEPVNKQINEFYYVPTLLIDTHKAYNKQATDFYHVPTLLLDTHEAANKQRNHWLLSCTNTSYEPWAS